jgi:hypothetical protein
MGRPRTAIRCRYRKGRPCFRARRGFGSADTVRWWQPHLGSGQRLHKAFPCDGLEQVVDRVDLESANRVLVMGCYERDRRHRLRSDFVFKTENRSAIFGLSIAHCILASARQSSNTREKAVREKAVGARRKPVPLSSEGDSPQVLISMEPAVDRETLVFRARHETPCDRHKRYSAGTAPVRRRRRHQPSLRQPAGPAPSSRPPKIACLSNSFGLDLEFAKWCAPAKENFDQPDLPQYELPPD